MLDEIAVKISNHPGLESVVFYDDDRHSGFHGHSNYRLIKANENTVVGQIILLTDCLLVVSHYHQVGHHFSTILLSDPEFFDAAGSAVCDCLHDWKNH